MIRKISTNAGLVFLAVMLIHCGSGKTSVSLEKNGVVRLMDLLQQDHITQTPFYGLKDQFKPVEDTLSGKTFLVPALSSSRQKVWGAATGYSVLGYGEGPKPPEMEVLLDEQPLPFFQKRNENEIGWQWIQTNKSFDLRFDDRFNKARQCLVLETGAGYEFDTFLPGGPVVLEILAERNRAPVQLEVKINDEIHSRENSRGTFLLFN